MLMFGWFDGVVCVIEFFRQILCIIYQNFGWVFGYNIVVILLVVLGVLNLVVVGVVMGFFLVSVVINLLWLCCFGCDG